MNTLILGSIISPLLAVMVVPFLWRKKQFHLLFLIFAGVSLIDYSLIVDDYSMPGVFIRSMLAGMLPIVGGLLYSRYFLDKDVSSDKSNKQ